MLIFWNLHQVSEKIILDYSPTPSWVSDFSQLLLPPANSDIKDTY